MAQSRYPDDVKKQNEYVEKQRQRNETETEYVKQAVGGIFDAGNSALNFTVNRFLDEDSKVLLPEIEGPKTTGQGLVRGGVQFMIPYLGWFKVIKGATIGAKLIKTKPKNKLSFKQDLAVGTGAGVIADVVHFEANDPTLSNLIQAYPHLRNPVTEYLQTNPDDPEAVNRFKRAVEGAGLGNFFAVILRGVGHGFTGGTSPGYGSDEYVPPNIGGGNAPGQTMVSTGGMGKAEPMSKKKINKKLKEIYNKITKKINKLK